MRLKQCKWLEDRSEALALKQVCLVGNVLFNRLAEVCGVADFNFGLYGPNRGSQNGKLSVSVVKTEGMKTMKIKEILFGCLFNFFYK